MKKLICILIGVFLLGACASSQTTSFDRVAVAMAGNNERSSGKLLMMNVPDAGNPVSNGIMLTALAGGTASNAVKGIVDMLAVPDVRIGIGGNSKAINIATLQRALKDFTGKSNAAVYIDASAEQVSALNRIAAAKNIQVYGVDAEK